MSGAGPDDSLLRRLPSVDRLLRAVTRPPEVPAAMAAELVRDSVAAWRRGAAESKAPPDFDEAVAAVTARLAALGRTRIQPVINATGILVHTNLGRSPLAPAIAARVAEIASGYHNLELDLDSGERGPRGRFLETSLALLAGAEAATVVNNCAAALVLVLRHLTRDPERREAIISRGQLVEIGGGFRVPEIMETSGAVLREVGATNRTRLDDYASAIGPRTALLLRVHRSNFFMEGYTGEPSLEELSGLARAHGLPLVDDLGSGAVVDTSRIPGLEHEPTPAESIAAGADVVCCSGDKLFGGPQSGLLFGRAELIGALKRDPLFRALRCDRLAYAALQETAAACLESGPGNFASAVPLQAMLLASAETLAARAEVVRERCAGAAAEIEVVASTARCGGGTMPKSSIPSAALRIRPRHLSAAALAAKLRTGRPPVMGCVTDGAVVLDFRTILTGQDEALAAALTAALGGS